MSKYVFVALVVLALLVAAGVCSAQTAVRPNAMNGWVLSSLNGAATDWTPNPPGGLGDGALWLFCGGWGGTSYEHYPGQIWMGTNAYNGTPLSQISLLAYKSWTANAGLYKANGGMLKDRWSGPRQQVQVQICINTGDGTKRMLFFRPRGNDFAPYVDDTNHENRWVENVPIGNEFVPSTGYWYDFEYQVALNKLADWAAVVAKYPNGTIAQPDQQPPSPYPTFPDASYDPWPNPTVPDTPNACGISLFWGAEERGTSSGGDTAGTSPIYSTPCNSKNWWRDSCNGISWVDDVRFEVNGNYSQYDFEPNEDQIRKAVTGSGKDLQSLTAFKSYRLFPFVAYGSIWSIGSDGEFCLDDGSPSVFLQSSATGTTEMKVWCRADTNSGLTVGDAKRVEGLLVPGYSNRWFETGPVLNRFHTKAGTLITPLY